MTLYREAEHGILLYYTLHDRQQGLTAPYTLTAAWRRGNGRERERFYAFDTLAERDRKLRELFRRRLREGYRLLYSFDRTSPAAEPAPESAPPRRRTHGS